MNQSMYPYGPTPGIISSIESRHHTFLTADPTSTYLKIIDTDLNDKTIAFAEWHVFSTPEEEASRLDLKPKTYPTNGDVDVRLATEFWSHITAARKTMAGKSHVFLSIIATDPTQGRRGAAGMLMQWGINEADRRGLPCFLESSPFGRGLYLKYGFEEVGDFVVNVGGGEMYRHFVMVRAAKGEGGES